MPIDKLDLKKYLETGISISDYYLDVADKVITGDKEHAYYPYYALNSQRMQRLRKKISLSEEQKEALANVDNINLLVITEGWCGDAAQVIPVVEKIVEASSSINAKVVYRDKNPTLMDAYLTNSGRSIPIVIGIDANSDEHIFRWGPRPEFGNILLNQYKEGLLSKEEFQIALQKAYNKDKGNAIINELIYKLKS